MFNQHRKNCKQCPYCGYKNKLYRLLAHMEKCSERGQDNPLDLTSPMKNTGIPQGSGEFVDLSVGVSRIDPCNPADDLIDMATASSSGSRLEQPR